jgi:hypothetical protein
VEVIEARIQNLYEDLKDDTISEAEYLLLYRTFLTSIFQIKLQIKIYQRV